MDEDEEEALIAMGPARAQLEERAGLLACAT